MLNRPKLCLMSLAATSALAMADQVDSPLLELVQAGVFFVGGHGASGGTEAGNASLSEKPAVQVTGQSLVHYFVPSEKRDVSIVLYPGLGLTSYIFLATPDGREGWATLFARDGFTTYVYDVPNTGISGFDIAPFNRAVLASSPSRNNRISRSGTIGRSGLDGASGRMLERPTSTPDFQLRT